MWATAPQPEDTSLFHNPPAPAGQCRATLLFRPPLRTSTARGRAGAAIAVSIAERTAFFFLGAMLHWSREILSPILGLRGTGAAAGARASFSGPSALQPRTRQPPSVSFRADGRGRPTFSASRCHSTSRLSRSHVQHPPDPRRPLQHQRVRPPGRTAPGRSRPHAAPAPARHRNGRTRRRARWMIFTTSCAQTPSRRWMPGPQRWPTAGLQYSAPLRTGSVLLRSPRLPPKTT